MEAQLVAGKCLIFLSLLFLISLLDLIICTTYSTYHLEQTLSALHFTELKCHKIVESGTPV